MDGGWRMEARQAEEVNSQMLHDSWLSKARILLHVAIKCH